MPNYSISINENESKRFVKMHKGKPSIIMPLPTEDIPILSPIRYFISF